MFKSFFIFLSGASAAQIGMEMHNEIDFSNDFRIPKSVADYVQYDSDVESCAHYHPEVDATDNTNLYCARIYELQQSLMKLQKKIIIQKNIFGYTTGCDKMFEYATGYDKSCLQNHVCCMKFNFFVNSQNLDFELIGRPSGPGPRCPS